MATFRNVFSYIIIVGFLAITGQGCAQKSRPVQIIDSSTGTEFEALKVVMDQDTWSQTYGDLEHTHVFSGSVGAMTSWVEIHEIKVKSSLAVGTMSFGFSDAKSTQEGTSVPGIKTTEHVILSKNGGWITKLDNSMSARRFWVSADLTGLANQDVTFEIVSVTVVTSDDPTMRELSVLNTKKTITVGESPKGTATVLYSPSYTHTSKGPGTPVAAVAIENQIGSTIYPNWFYVLASEEVQSLNVVDASGTVLLVGEKQDGSNQWIFTNWDGLTPGLNIPGGGTNNIFFQADTTGMSSNYLSIYVSGFQMTNAGNKVSGYIDPPIDPNTGLLTNFISNW